MKKYGGRTIVIGPSGRVGGESYNYNEHKQNIVTTLNELGKAITDIGLIAALHQHTGTAVETRDETYATMEAVDTRYVKFGPDIGQLQKGGVDPVAVVKQFLPVVQHMHFKDWVGGPSMAGYCALGLGKVDLVGILDLMEGRKLDGHDDGRARRRRPDAVHAARGREDRTRLARQERRPDESVGHENTIHLRDRPGPAHSVMTAAVSQFVPIRRPNPCSLSETLLRPANLIA